MVVAGSLAAAFFMTSQPAGTWYGTRFHAWMHAMGWAGGGCPVHTEVYIVDGEHLSPNFGTNNPTKKIYVFGLMCSECGVVKPIRIISREQQESHKGHEDRYFPYPWISKKVYDTMGLQLAVSAEQPRRSRRMK